MDTIDSNTAAFVFRSAHGVICSVEDRLRRIPELTIPELKIIAGDADCQMTVRRKAEATMRKMARLASGFPALNEQARKGSAGHLHGKFLPKLRASRQRGWE